MRKKNTLRDNVNLILSAFLILGYIVCSYFCLQLTSQLSVLSTSIIKATLFFVFGLLLFYATRVGDGKPVLRFSLFTLLILDIPAIYVIVASFAKFLPLHNQIMGQELILVLACIALGYGIPYTFISGFELVVDDDSDELLKGGLEESLADAADESDVQRDSETKQENAQAEENADARDDSDDAQEVPDDNAEENLSEESDNG